MVYIEDKSDDLRGSSTEFSTTQVPSRVNGYIPLKDHKAFDEDTPSTPTYLDSDGPIKHEELQQPSSANHTSLRSDLCDFEAKPTIERKTSSVDLKDHHKHDTLKPSYGNLCLESIPSSGSLHARLPTFYASSLGPWHSLVAYDACVRLCLHPWVKGCLEAPMFLENERALLRSTFKYLSYIMNVATPTADCLSLVYDLLLLVMMKGHKKSTLSHQEIRILGEIDEQIEQILTVVSDNYKSSDENSPCGKMDVHRPGTGVAPSVLEYVVKLYKLTNDILSPEAQNKLYSYFQAAAKKRSRQRLAETDEYVSGNGVGVLMDPVAVSTSYRKMKSLCLNLRNEIFTDIEVHNYNILPGFIDLPNLSSAIYSAELSSRLRAFLIACSLTAPSPHVTDLVVATAGFQKDLVTWIVNPVKYGVDETELFHLYILIWIQDKCLHFLVTCKLDKAVAENMTPKKFGLKYVQKLTKRTTTPYIAPPELGVLLNSVKRMLDVSCCIPDQGNVAAGERLSKVTLMLRSKFRNYLQAVVEKLVENPKRSTMEVHIPHDVVLNHILPRAPAKSVCRFKCVSKEWHSFLSSDMFINEHNRHLDHHKNNLKLLLMSKTETSFEFTTIDCEAPLSDKGLTPTHRPLPPFGGTTRHINVLTSFHGLVCLGIMKYIRSDVDQYYSDLILWNPLTNEYKRLPESNIYKEFDYRKLFFELYYSSDEDDYKLLLVRSFDENVYIYSLRLDSWREVDDAFQLIGRIYPGVPSRGTYLNGDLYFVCQELGCLWSIIKFDTKSELFLEIQTPNVYVDSNPDNEDNSFATIVVISDCIHVCVKYDTFTSDSCCESTICIKLWKLDEDEDMKEVLSYQLRPLSYDDRDSMNYLIPFHLMKNGNWLMLMNSPSYNHRIYEVRLKKKMHITNKGKEEEKGKIYDDFEYANVTMDSTNINELVDKEVGYIETFVSPNRYMK